MKTVKILSVAAVVIALAAIAIQLFVKQKVVLENGQMGTAGVFNKALSRPGEISLELETENL